MAVVLHRSAVATSDIKIEPLMTIRVDREGCYWWSTGRESEDNLPTLVPRASFDDEAADWFPDYDSLRTIIIDYASSYRSGYLVIAVHPGSHHLHFGNLYAFLESLYLDDAERYAWADYEMEAINDSVGKIFVDIRAHRVERERMFKRRAELRRLPRFRLRHCVRKWEERDSRMMQFACEKAGVASASDTNLSPEMSFAAHWEAGEWDEQLARNSDLECDYSLPTVAAPKVGIPKPIQEPDLEDE